MISKKGILLSMVMVVMASTQGLSPAHAMDEKTSEVQVRNSITNESHIIPYFYGENWGQLKQEIKEKFGYPGVLLYAGKQVPDDYIIRHGEFHGVGRLFYCPIEAPSPTSAIAEKKTLSSAKLCEVGEKLLASLSEDEINKGARYVAFAQIKEAIEQENWETALRRLTRMDEDAQSDPIAIDMGKEIRKYINR